MRRIAVAPEPRMIALFRLAFRFAMPGVTAGTRIMAVTLATVDLSPFVAGGASVQQLPRPRNRTENVTLGSGAGLLPALPYP